MNLQHFTPETLNIIAKKGMVPMAVLVVLGGGLFFAKDEVSKANGSLEFQIDNTRWQIEENRDRIANIEAEFSTIRLKSRQYSEIDQAGFFRNQERLVATQLLESLARERGLTKLTFKFEPQTVQPFEGESDETFELLQTEVVIDTAALTDADLLGFAAEFIFRLDGQVQVNRFVLKQLEEINETTILDVSRGSLTELFESQLEINWNNLRRVEDLAEDAEP